MGVIAVAGHSGFVFDYMNLGFFTIWGPLTSFLIGFIIGLVEEFIYINVKTHLHFVVEFIIKVSFYSAYSFLMFFLVILLYQHYYGLRIDNYYEYFTSYNYMIPMLIVNLSIDYLILFMFLNKLLGRGMFFKYLMGKYRKPKEEERIFMFIDLNSSTEIAEQFGHKKFFNFLNDFFSDLTEPILRSSAHVYQFIGDEVVLTWKMKEGLKSSNCISIYFMILENIKARNQFYLKKYGRIPKFKVGAHYGKVITSELGDLKKEIVFNGDVLNTTARIRSRCSELKCGFLISKKLHDQLGFPRNIVSKSKGTYALKGKVHNIELFEIMSYK